MFALDQYVYHSYHSYYLYDDNNELEFVLFNSEDFQIFEDN